jgi:hypothetical protein
MAMRAKNREIRTQLTDALIEEELQSQAQSRSNKDTTAKSSIKGTTPGTPKVKKEPQQKPATIKTQQQAEAKEPVVDNTVNGVCVYPSATHTYTAHKIQFAYSDPVSYTDIVYTQVDESCFADAVVDTDMDMDLDTHGSTTASPIVLPANCEFSRHVPVIQAFPSPPMSPTTTMTTCVYVLENTKAHYPSQPSKSLPKMQTQMPAQLSQNHDFSLFYDEVSMTHTFSDSDDDEEDEEDEEDDSSAMNTEVFTAVCTDAVNSNTHPAMPDYYLTSGQQAESVPDNVHVPYVHAQQVPVLCAPEQPLFMAYRQQYLNAQSQSQQQMQIMQHHQFVSQDEAQTQSQTHVVLNSWLANDDSMMEGIEDLLSSPLASPPPVCVSPAASTVDEEPSPYGQASHKFEPDISVAFMQPVNDEADDLFNWVVDDMEDPAGAYGRTQSQFPSQAHSHGKSSSKRCSSTNWCGVGMSTDPLMHASAQRHSQFQAQAHAQTRWGANNSAFCGLGSALQHSQPRIQQPRMQMPQAQVGIGMAHTQTLMRTESPVRKQQRPSSWRIGW